MLVKRFEIDAAQNAEKTAHVSAGTYIIHITAASDFTATFYNGTGAGKTLYLAIPSFHNDVVVRLDVADDLSKTFTAMVKGNTSHSTAQSDMSYFTKQLNDITVICSESASITVYVDKD